MSLNRSGKIKGTLSQRSVGNKGIFFIFEVPAIILAQFASIVGLVTRLMKASLDEISSRYEASPIMPFEIWIFQSERLLTSR